jgi:hypothetical protein
VPFVLWDVLDDNMMNQRIFEINGNNFDDFSSFIVEFNRCFVSHVGGKWQGNLDAFNDYLSWMDQRCTIRWLNSSKSEKDLGYESMVSWLSRNLETCHPSNRLTVQARLEDAINGHGPTLFEWIVQIIRDTDDYVDLQLI